jgi:DNA-binding winged helix-turn-helix (wHTH) protein
MTKATHIYAFDDCLLDVEQGLFLVDSAPVHLDPKEFSLLKYMVRNPERVLEKDELLKAGWDEFVEEGRLTQVVHSLRNKIGRSYIETVRNTGYRFNAQVIDKSSISDDGLGAFDESQAEYFFGRDEEIEVLVDRLMKERFIAIIGSSGRGKSSIVNAGIIPFLRRNAIAGQEWKTIVLRPTHLPLRSLAVSLLELGDVYPTEELSNELTQQLLNDPLTLTHSVAASSGDSRKPNLLVVDQFEEVFSPYITNRDKEASLRIF